MPVYENVNDLFIGKPRHLAVRTAADQLTIKIGSFCKFCGKEIEDVIADFCKECVGCPKCGSEEFVITHIGLRFSRCMICLVGWQTINGKKKILGDSTGSFFPSEEILKRNIAKSKTS